MTYKNLYSNIYTGTIEDEDLRIIEQTYSAIRPGNHKYAEFIDTKLKHELTASYVADNFISTNRASIISNSYTVVNVTVDERMFSISIGNIGDSSDEFIFGIVSK